MRHLGLALVGVRVHRPELEDPERAAGRADPDLAKENRARRVDLDHQREQRKKRRKKNERRIVRARSVVRFTRRDDRDSRSGGSPMSGRPSTVWTSTRSDELEESRHDIDLHVEVLEGAKPLECLLVRVVREGDDHALDVEEADHRREPLDTAEQRQVLETLSALLRLGVDEADQVDPVFGMDKELLREQLADVAGTDDDRVLDVGHVSPCKRSRHRAADADERDCEGPEDEELLRARMRDIAQMTTT